MIKIYLNLKIVLGSKNIKNFKTKWWYVYVITQTAGFLCSMFPHLELHAHSRHVLNHQQWGAVVNGFFWSHVEWLLSPGITGIISKFYQDRKSPYQKEDNLWHFSLAQLSDRSMTLYAICCLIRKMENMKQALGVLLPASACIDSRELGENPRGHLFVSRADQGPRIFIIQRGEINLVR